MNMKNFKKAASIVALLITGLLVITGCQGIFEPPAKPAAADGTGTLYLSINEGGRTILPAAKLDRYDITITSNDTNWGDNGVTDYSNTSGSTGIVLPSATYSIKVEGFIIKEVDGEDEDILVADDTETGVVIGAGQVVNVSIDLTPADTGIAYNGGKGYFAWDFDGVSISDLTIGIYDATDTTQAVGTNDYTDLADEVELDVGVYWVRFEATAAEKTYKWGETLYIYAGLTSKYGAADFATNETAPEIYVTPADGTDYFYLNLNKWTTVATAIQTTPVTGTIAANKLTVNYTVNDQRLNIKLSAAQVAILNGLANSATVVVEIVGSATPNSSFRYHFADPAEPGTWNGSASFDAAPFTGVKAKRVTISGNQNARNTALLGYLIVQQRVAATTTVEIESIKVSYGATLPNVPVSIRAIPLTSPLDGGTPEATISTAEYTGTVVWEDIDETSSWDPDDDTFAEDSEYKATVTLTASTGYDLSTIDIVGPNVALEDFFTVGDSTSAVYEATGNTVTVTFPATEKIDFLPINVAGAAGATTQIAYPPAETSGTADIAGWQLWNAGVKPSKVTINGTKYDGYRSTPSAGNNWTYTAIKVDLGDKTLADYKAIKLTYQPVGGSLGYNRVQVLATDIDTAFPTSGGLTVANYTISRDSVSGDPDQYSNQTENDTRAKNMTIWLDPAKKVQKDIPNPDFEDEDGDGEDDNDPDIPATIKVDSSELRIAFWTNTGPAWIFQVANIEFVPAD